MSYREWVSSNGRGRLRVYSDDMLCRFDKLSGSMASRHLNAMIEYEDSQTRERLTIVAEKLVLWEEGNRVYIQVTGRRISRTESLPTGGRPPILRRNRRAIGVYNEV